MTDLDVRDTSIEQIFAPEPLRKRAGGFLFLEGAVWNGDERALVFSDIPGDRLLRFDVATEQVTVYRDPSNKTNGNVYDHRHRLISCEHSTSRVVREEADGTITILASEYDGIELNSPNDVVVDAAGRVVFTDPPYGRMNDRLGIERPQLQPVQGVYRIEPNDGTITRLADDFEKPNGLCFAEEGNVLFVNDTARKHIRRFEVRGQDVAGGEVWAETTGEAPGGPDGMKVDSEGNVFCCCGGNGIHVFGSDGRLLGILRVPEPVANFNWGDDDLKTLYLCASTGLYSCRLRVPGQQTW